MSSDPWNKCDVCGQFISTEAFVNESATRVLIQPDNEYGSEIFETLCSKHKES